VQWFSGHARGPGADAARGYRVRALVVVRISSVDGRIVETVTGANLAGMPIPVRCSGGGVGLVFSRRGGLRLWAKDPGYLVRSNVEVLGSLQGCEECRVRAPWFIRAVVCIGIRRWGSAMRHSGFAADVLAGDYKRSEIHGRSRMRLDLPVRGLRW